MASQNIVYAGRQIGTAISPVTVASDPRTGGGLAAKPGTWAFDGTYYYEAYGTGANDWRRTSYVSAEQEFVVRARDFLGSGKIFYYFTDFPEGAMPNSLAIGSSGTVGAGTSTITTGSIVWTGTGPGSVKYSYFSKATGGITPIPSGATGEWYIAARIKADAATTDATFGCMTTGATLVDSVALGLQGRAGDTTKFGMRVAGAGGGAAGVLTGAARDGNWHVHEGARVSSLTYYFLDRSIGVLTGGSSGNYYDSTAAGDMGLCHNNSTADPHTAEFDWAGWAIKDAR